LPRIKFSELEVCSIYCTHYNVAGYVGRPKVAESRPKYITQFIAICRQQVNANLNISGMGSRKVPSLNADIPSAIMVRNDTCVPIKAILDDVCHSPHVPYPQYLTFACNAVPYPLIWLVRKWQPPPPFPTQSSSPQGKQSNILPVHVNVSYLSWMLRQT
jgi:hypothetical protein